MLGMLANLLPLARVDMPPSGRTCPVCRADIRDGDRYLSVRGMRFHHGCAAYGMRRAAGGR